MVRPLSQGWPARTVDKTAARQAAFCFQKGHEEDLEGSQEDHLLDGQGHAGSDQDGVRHRVRYLPRSSPAARPRLHHEGPRGPAHPQGQQAEDSEIPEEDAVAHPRKGGGRLHQVRPGRDRRDGRRQSPQGHLHPKGKARRLHLHGIPRQDGRLWADHRRRAQLLQTARQVHQGRVRRLPKGGARAVRQADYDDPGQGAPAQGQDHPGDAQGSGWLRRIRIPPAGLSGSQRNRGGLAPDEARRPRHLVRDRRRHARGHRQVARLVGSRTGHRKVPLPDGLGPDLYRRTVWRTLRAPFRILGRTPRTLPQTRHWQAAGRYFGQFARNFSDEDVFAACRGDLISYFSPAVCVNTPEQNGHIESFHKTLKKEYVWPREFADIQEAKEVCLPHSRTTTTAEYTLRWDI